MIGDPFVRARVWGVVIVVGAFGLGVTTGVVFARRPTPGVVMTVISTDALPKELSALGLSETQRARIRDILRAGRPRVLAVLTEADTRMRAALDLTNAEIERVLTADQLARWQASRRLNPPRTEQRFLRK